MLAPDAFVRTYVGDAGRGWIVVRLGRGGRTRIDAQTRAVLALVDGGRTLEQIARAFGAERGRPARVSEVQELLRPLVQAGAVLDASSGVRPAAAQPTGLEVIRIDEAQAARLALVVAPDTHLDCDGRGGCCRLYDRLLLVTDDVGRIHQAYRPDEHTPGGLYLESAILRHRDDHQEDYYEVAVVDGACSFLAADGLCDVHKRLGATQKPVTCQSYPIRDVLFDDELHVGLGVECRCVVELSAAPSPPLEGAARELLERRRQLRLVEAVRENVSLTLGALTPRAEYRRWWEPARARQEAAADLADWAAAEAAALVGAPPRRAAGLLQALPQLADTLAEELAQEAADTARVYSARDLQRQAFAWGAQAASRLREALTYDDMGGAPPVAGEHVLARQALFTHALLRARTVAVGLVGMALRLWLAREGAPLPLPRELTPITTVEYLHRAHGTSRILDRHAEEIEATLRST
jgi:lysine-N-methylase